MKPRLQWALMFMAVIATASTLLFTGSADVAGATLRAALPTARTNIQSASQASTVNPPNGAGSFVGGNNLNTSFQIPLLRTDVASTSFSENYNSIIHVANSTTGSTNLTVTFYNPDGSVNPTRNVAVPSTLQTWQTVDLDVAQILGTGFLGSATVTSSPNAVALSVDFTNGSLNTDNFDSYAGITAPAQSLYFPFGIHQGQYSTKFWIRNTSTSTANVTLQLFQDGNVQQTTSSAIPPLGQVMLQSIQFNYSAGPAQLTSDQPISAVAEVFGGAFSSVGAFTPVTTSSTLFIPRFQFNLDPSTSWASNLIVTNTTPSTCTSNCNASFTATFYNPNGTVAGTLNSPVDGVKPMHDWVVGDLPFSSNQPPPPQVPSGYVGSVVITNSGGFPIAPLLLTLQGRVDTNNAIKIAYDYTSSMTKPVGQWAYLPNIRKSSGGQTTAFTIMNVDTSAQDYTITYWNHDGSLHHQASLSLLPNQSWYQSQAVDGSLPTGFDGSVQLTNISRGAPPAAVVELFGGAVTPPTPPVLTSPTPFPTPAASCVPKSTPVPSTPTSGSTPVSKVFLPTILDNYTSGC